MNQWFMRHFPNVWGRWRASRILSTSACSVWLHAGNPDFTMWQQTKWFLLCCALFVLPGKLPLKVKVSTLGASGNDLVDVSKGEPTVLIGAKHPILGWVYQNYLSGADENAPDHCGYTLDVECATHFDKKWRSYGFFNQKWGWGFVHSVLNSYVEDDSDPFDFRSMEIIKNSDLPVASLWPWLLAAEWQDIPAVGYIGKCDIDID